jgi:hypothetical protein
VVGDATHGNGLAFFAIARGEGDLKFAGGDDGVFVEEFVEIAEAEEEEGVRVAGFDRVVLLHEWGGGFGHGESSKFSVISNALGRVFLGIERIAGKEGKESEEVKEVKEGEIV